MSPSGRRSLAFYHRPMLHLSSVDGRAAIPMIERMPFEDRESIRIAYVPLDSRLKGSRTISATSAESVQVLCPDANWGSIKIGAGTPPVRSLAQRREGWMSVFHGVDVIGDACASRRCATAPASSSTISSARTASSTARPSRFCRPNRGANAAASSTTSSSRRESIRAPISASDVYDIYYGMGDYSVGAARMRVG